MDHAETYTQSSLSAARACSMLYELRYNQRLTRDADDEREPLQVGHCWHRAHDVAAKGGNPYEAIANHAPSLLWSIKLSRMFAAYGWYWRDQALQIVESETTFRIEHRAGRIFEGQCDGVLKTPDGRGGIVERKTTSESLDADSHYWSKLRLDVQVGLYGLFALARTLTSSSTMPNSPNFILYDVARKPTIGPRAITKVDARRMRMELDARGRATYYGEKFDASVVGDALDVGKENEFLFGARLTADIGDRPDHYFARREVPRTKRDYEALVIDLDRQVEMIEYAESRNLWHHNPDACHSKDRGTCEFFSLCARNAQPHRGSAAPEGFRVREHTHPELRH